MGYAVWFLVVLCTFFGGIWECSQQTGRSGTALQRGVGHVPAERMERASSCPTNCRASQPRFQHVLDGEEPLVQAALLSRPLARLDLRGMVSHLFLDHRSLCL